MPNINFRRFKYVVFYAGATAVIAANLYWLAELAGQRADSGSEQNRYWEIVGRANVAGGRGDLDRLDCRLYLGDDFGGKARRRRQGFEMAAAEGADGPQDSAAGKA